MRGVLSAQDVPSGADVVSIPDIDLDSIVVDDVVVRTLSDVEAAKLRDIIKLHKPLLLTIGYGKIDSIFGNAEFLRNCCAHPTGMEDERWFFTPDPEIDESKFGDLYRDIRWLTTEMREQTERENSVRNSRPPSNG